MHSVPDEPPWCQGLLLTARDLVFGVIDFGLYYTLLTNLRFVRFGTQRRSRTYVKGLEDPCTIRYTNRAYVGLDITRPDELFSNQRKNKVVARFVDGSLAI